MKTAFVTGGSRGIGKSIALDLGNKFHVVVGYSVSNEKAEEVSEKIISNGGSSSTVQINISETSSVDEAFSSIEKDAENSHASPLLAPAAQIKYRLPFSGNWSIDCIN